MRRMALVKGLEARVHWGDESHNYWCDSPLYCIVQYACIVWRLYDKSSRLTDAHELSLRPGRLLDVRVPRRQMACVPGSHQRREVF